MAEIDVKIKIAGEQAKQSLNQFTKAVKDADTVVGSLQGTVKGLGGAFSVFAGTIAAAAVQRGISSLVGGLNDFVRSSVDAASQIETLQARFQILTGSLEDAARLTNDIQDIADNSPFDDLKVANAARELLLFGTNVNDVKGELQLLGDVSVASGLDLEQLTTIFGRIRDTGALTADTFRLLVKNGIPIGDELSKTLGVSEQAVKKLAAEGKISADVFEQAFQRLNKEGSFAFQAIEKQGATLEGRLKKLRDNFDNLREDVGAKLNPALKAIATAFGNLIERIRVSPGFQQFIDTLATRIPQAISFTFDALSFLSDAFFFTVKAVNFAKAGLAAIEIVAIDAGIAFLKAGQFIDKFLNKFTDRSEAISGTQALIDNLTLLREVVSEQGADLVATNNELSKSQEKFNQSIEESKTFVLDTYNTELAKIKEVDEAQDSRAEKQKVRNQFISEADQKLISDREKNLNDIAILEEAWRLQQSEAELLFTDNRLILTQDNFTREQEARLQAQIMAADSELQKETIITDALKQGLENRFKLQDAADKADIERTKKAAEAKKKLQETFRDQEINLTRGFFGLASAVAKQGSKEQFLIQKAGAVAELSLARGKAIGLIPAQTAAIPYPANLAAAAQLAANANIAFGLGVATVGASAIQGFQDGGVVGGNSFSGDRVVARVNSGEMILNREQQSTLFNQLNSGASSSGQNVTVHTNVVVDGEVIARAVSTQVANGFQLGDVQ
jgi:tape measure domain-containing protein